MSLSEHFAISFELLLRKPDSVTKKVMSRCIRSVDMHVFRTYVHIALKSAAQSDSADSLGICDTCLPQLLDYHARLITTETERTSAPWITLQVKEAKIKQNKKWRVFGKWRDLCKASESSVKLDKGKLRKTISVEKG